MILTWQCQIEVAWSLSWTSKSMISCSVLLYNLNIQPKCVSRTELRSIRCEFARLCHQYGSCNRTAHFWGLITKLVRVTKKAWKFLCAWENVTWSMPQEGLWRLWHTYRPANLNDLTLLILKLLYETEPPSFEQAGWFCRPRMVSIASMDRRSP